MASIFPAGGVAPGAGVPNAYVPKNKPSGCPALYYADDCTTVLTTEALNAMVSELLAVVDKLNIAWNCASVTNLADALLQEFEIIRTAIEAVQADLTALATRVDAVEAKATSLQEQVDAIKAQITDIDTAIADLGTRIDNLTAGDIRLDPQIGDYINVQQALAGLVAGDYAQTAAVIISDVPPANPAPGQLWWSSVNGELLLWYDDGDSQQWVAATDTGQGLKDAPYDGKAYARKDGEWTDVGDGGGGGGIPEAPSDGSLYGRQDAGWRQVPPAPGAQVTILDNQLYLYDGDDPSKRMVEEWGFYDGTDPLDGTVTFATDFIEAPQVTLTMQGDGDLYRVQSISLGSVTAYAFTFYRRTWELPSGFTADPAPRDMLSIPFAFWWRALGKVA